MGWRKVTFKNARCTAVTVTAAHNGGSSMFFDSISEQEYGVRWVNTNRLLYIIFGMSFPKATVGRGINATLPEGLSASEETVEAITKCCAEFVSLVASEARDVRKSSLMTQQDVVTAIKKLGLESYLEGVEEDVEAEAKKAREKKRKRRPKQTKEEQEAAAKKQRELLKATEARFRIGQQLS